MRLGFTLPNNWGVEDPHQVAEGMVHVLVNGRFAIRDGVVTDARAGEVLRRR